LLRSQSRSGRFRTQYTPLLLPLSEPRILTPPASSPVTMQMSTSCSNAQVCCNCSNVAAKHVVESVISDFCCEVDQNCAVLGYYVASSCNYLQTFRNIFLFKNPRKAFGFLTLKMLPIDCQETSIKNYNCSLRNNPEEGSSYKSKPPLL
jgi:hypothetical protein